MSLTLNDIKRSERDADSFGGSGANPSLNAKIHKQVVDPNGMETRCGFRLVDLAGSERQKHSRVEGKHLKEAANINQSLTALGKVFNTQT